MKRLLVAAGRRLADLRRPSKSANDRLLRERGERAASFVIRDATLADVPALARLHVTTFHETHGGTPGRGPSYELREQQWGQVVGAKPSDFVFVVVRPNGDLVGFARGHALDDTEPSGYAGRLNKIYFLREYQRLGLGRRLIGHVARRFLEQGIDSMLVFSETLNPSCFFYESLGGENLRDANGNVSYSAYGWRDLRKLAAICPVE